MTNNDIYLGGTNTLVAASGNAPAPQAYEWVIDVAELISSGFASLDVVRFMQLEAGSVLHYIDAEIVEALSLDSSTAGRVDIGNTISSSTDPDDYVNDSSATSVGRLTSYESAATAAAVLSADCYLALRLTGNKFSGGTNNATGKIAIRAVISRPAKYAVGRTGRQTLTHRDRKSVV